MITFSNRRHTTVSKKSPSLFAKFSIIIFNKLQLRCTAQVYKKNLKLSALVLL